MTIGSFSVRAVGPRGQQLANVAAISTGPAAALLLVQNAQIFPEGTRFHVRGGAPRRPHDYAGLSLDGAWLDEWGQIERFDEDPDDALEEFRGDEKLAYVIGLLILAIAALQALRWMLS